VLLSREKRNIKEYRLIARSRVPLVSEVGWNENTLVLFVWASRGHSPVSSILVYASPIDSGSF
jgi:hypothetical protein